MCGMGKTPIVSCQVSFYPLYTEDCIATVKEVVDISGEAALFCIIGEIPPKNWRKEGVFSE